MLKFFYSIFWCFTGVKHLSTCNLSDLWLLADPSDQNSGRHGRNRLFSLLNPTPLCGFQKLYDHHLKRPLMFHKQNDILSKFNTKHKSETDRF